jgi:hypothetical protein
MTLQNVVVFKEKLMAQNWVTEQVITRLISLTTVSDSAIRFGWKVQEYSSASVFTGNTF